MAFNIPVGDGYPTPTPSPPTEPAFDTSPITVLASSRAVVSGILTPATIVISTTSGKISSITRSILPPSEFPSGTPYVDHSPHILFPGLVDAHVHLNEPGRTEWEGFETGTKAAAFGGVTTVIDMPLNAIPPTTTVNGLKEKIKAAQGQCWVDVGFYGGIIPGNAGELKALVNEGVKGFKGFLCDSGVSSYNLSITQNDTYSKMAVQVPEFPAVSSKDIAKVMTELADMPTTLMFHAEMIPPIADSVGDTILHSEAPLAPKGPLTSYSTFLQSRPSSFETYAISQVLSLAYLAPNLPLHIVHLSAIEAIPLLREARANGVNITAETCFHYLSLAAENVAEGDTRHKCCPPIRTQANQNGLWDEVLREVKGGTGDGVIKTIVSDHSPCTPNLKLLPSSMAALSGEDRHVHTHGLPPTPPNESHEAQGDFFSAWGGISSVGLGLPILWTTAISRKQPLTPESVVQFCCQNTARQVGLEHQKGDLAVGLDGDVAVFDDEAEFVVGREEMLFRNKCSPYQGMRLKGVVKETWVRGRKVFQRGKGFIGAPGGQLLLEKRTIKV
ncbi:MAG: hypothetical protein M1834_001393 [Cirrosporium novae-zelandiae]|nr:MAG: hypothetical protein M1834_001393 [Cirrosporium novae-zelandiae]